MISRSDWEPLPTPTLSPFALARPGSFLSVSVFSLPPCGVCLLCGCRWFIPLINTTFAPEKKSMRAFRFLRRVMPSDK